MLFSWKRWGWPRKHAAPRRKKLRSFRPGVEVLEERVLLNATSEQFVERIYDDLLQRPVDAAGRTFWTDLLDSGAARGQVARGLLDSAEYRSSAIEYLYSSHLDRAADTGGLDYWLQTLAAGVASETVEASILGSPEYFQHHGHGADNTFLASLYHDALGRAIDADGSTFWGKQLQNGVARTDVAHGILHSLEGLQHRVELFYERLLDRSAEHDGLNFWSGAMQQGMAPEQVLAAFVGCSRSAVNNPLVYLIFAERSDNIHALDITSVIAKFFPAGYFNRDGIGIGGFSCRRRDRRS